MMLRWMKCAYENVLLKNFIKNVCQNHIREGGNGNWIISRMGMVWYDPDNSYKTFDEALSHLLKYDLEKIRPERKSEAERTNQKLRVEIEKLKLEIMELKK